MGLLLTREEELNIFIKVAIQDLADVKESIEWAPKGNKNGK